MNYIEEYTIQHVLCINIVISLHMELIIAPQSSSSFITAPPRTIVTSFQSTGHPSGAVLYFWLLQLSETKERKYMEVVTTDT